MKKYTVPLLGELTHDESFYNNLCSQTLALPLLRNHPCRLVLEEYTLDPHPEDFNQALANLLAADFTVLQAAEPFIFAYYQDMNSDCDPDDDFFVAIATPSELWQHIQFPREISLTRRAEDQKIYVSFYCWCDWEEEHGLQIVLKNGERVTKVGPYDGHLSHASSYANPKLEDVIYPYR